MIIAAIPATGAPAPRAKDDESTLAPGSDTGRGIYSHVVEWAFNVFSSTRLLTYFPTFWAICASADSSQHSLLTWGMWVGSNASMAAWLYEKNGRRINKAVAVTIGNSLMCATACVLIWLYRN